MQLALTIVLVALYLRLTQALIGVFPGGGVVLGWFCGPALMMVATGFLAYLICAFLPRRWEDGRPYGAAPRKVHPSWRSAVLLPVMVPWVLFSGNFLWQVRNADWTEIISLKWPIAVVIVLAAILAWTIHKARRDRRLLRDGEIADDFAREAQATGEKIDSAKLAKQEWPDTHRRAISRIRQ